MTASHEAPRLSGARILVVEDSYFVALAISKILKGLGCIIVGPAPSVAAGLEVLEREGCDAAVLDINLGSETAEGVAKVLAERQIPFLFITGYSSPRMLAPEFRSQPQLTKPVNPEALREAIEAELSSGARRN